MTEITPEKWQKLLLQLGPDGLTILNRSMKFALMVWHSYVGLEHVFITLCYLPGGLTDQALQSCGLNPSLLGFQITKKIGTTNKQPPRDIIPNPRLIHLLETAIANASEGGFPKSGEKHLLLALLTEEDSLPIRMLQTALASAGHDLASFRSAIERIQWSAPASLKDLPYAGERDDDPSGEAEIFLPVEDLNSMAAEFMQEGHYPESLMMINQAIKNNPQNAATYNTRGVILDHLDMPDAALQDFLKAVELEPRYARALFNLAAQLERRGDPAGAMAYLNQSMQIEPENPGSHGLKGKLLASDGNRDGALDAFNEALRLNPDLHWVYLERGSLKALMMKFVDAEKDLDRVLELNPSLLQAWGIRATVRSQLGNHRGAIQDLDQGIALAGDNGLDASVYFASRAKEWLSLDMPSEAEADFRKAIELNGENGTLLGELGRALVMLGRFNEAFENLTQAIQLKPNEVSYLFNRSNALAGMENHIDALKDLDRVIKIKPDFQQAYLNRSNIHLRLGNQSETFADLQKALELNPDDSKAIFNLASLALGGGKKSEAMELLERAARLGDMRAAEVLAEQKKQDGETGGSIDLLQQAIEAFEVARDRLELEQAVLLHPLMMEPAFADAIQQKIRRRMENERDGLYEKLSWLYEIPRHENDSAKRSFKKGDRIGNRYLVTDSIKGGLGEVYLCYDLELNTPFALKTIQDRFRGDPEKLMRFHGEAENWIRLGKHPNIVRCFGFTEIDAQEFLILEWIGGDSGLTLDLRTILQQGGLDIRQSLDWVIQICRGLVYAGEKIEGIVHGDLTPGNILLAEATQVKISDFGLSLSPDQLNRGSVDAITGTPPYMAPEQWRAAKLDARTDIYAAGCMLYEMLTGHPPYSVVHADSADALQEYGKWKDLHENAPRPHLPPEMPAGLDEVIRTCLSKSPSQRYESANSLLEALDSLYIVLFGTSPEPPKQIDGYTGSDFITLANVLSGLGHLEEALQNHNQALELMPDLASEHSNRSNVFRQLGRYEEALAGYARAMELNSGYAPAYLNRASLYVEIKQYEKALPDVDRCLKLDAGLKMAYLVRARALRHLKKYEESCKDCDTAIQMDTNFTDAYVERGEVLSNMGRTEAALNDYNKAIELNQGVADAYNRRGMLFAGRQQFQQAAEDFRQAIQLNPRLALAHVNLGLIDHGKQRYQEAIEKFTVAIELDSTLAIAYMARGGAKGFMGKNEAAVQDLDKAIGLDPQLSIAYLLRATALATLHRYDAALLDSQKALELNPSLSAARQIQKEIENRLRIKTNSDNNMKSRMRADKQEVLGVQNHRNEIDSADACLNRAHELYNQGQFEQAVDFYERAIVLDGNLLPAYSSRGNALAKLGRYEPALRSHNQAIQLDPNHANSYLNRGSTYAMMGDSTHAIADWRQALSLDPEATGAHRNLGFKYFELMQFYKAAYNLDEAARRQVPQAAQVAMEARKIVSMSIYLFMQMDSEQEISKLAKQYPFFGDPDFIESSVTSVIRQNQGGDLNKIFNKFVILWKLTSPSTLEERMRRANSFLRLRAHDLALMDFQQVLQTEPGNQEAWIGQSISLYALGRIGESIEVLDSLIKQFPLNSQAHFWKGLAIEKTGQVEAGLRLLDRAIEFSPNFVDAYYERGRIKSVLDVEGALVDLAKAEALGHPLAAGLAQDIKTRSKS